MKRALITGITGQDGSYLAELLLTRDMRSLVLPGKRAGTNPTVPAIFRQDQCSVRRYDRGCRYCQCGSGLTAGRDLSSRIPVKTGRILGRAAET